MEQALRPEPIIAPQITPVIAERSVSATELVILTNEERRKNNLWALTHSPELEASAKEKACDMDMRNYFSHQDPEGDWPWPLFIKHGYNYLEAGENLAQGYWKSQSVINSWMISPTHRENILSPKYYEMGIATCGNYTVQHFGAR